MQRNVIHKHNLFVHHKGMFCTLFICTKECCTQYTTKECCTQYLFGQRNVLHNICTKERCTNYLYKGMLYTISIRTKEYCTHYLYKGMLYTIFFNWKLHFLQQGLSFAVVYSILNISTQKPLIDTGLTGKFLFIVNDSFNVHLIYTWVIIFCIKYKTFLKNQIRTLLITWTRGSPFCSHLF